MSEHRQGQVPDPTAQQRPATGQEMGRVADAPPAGQPLGGSPLAPPINVSQFPQIEGEDMVTVRVPQPGITLTLDPHLRRLIQQFGTDRVEIPAGQYEIPGALADHWYVKRIAVETARRQTEGLKPATAAEGATASGSVRSPPDPTDAQLRPQETQPRQDRPDHRAGPPTGRR